MSDLVSHVNRLKFRLLHTCEPSENVKWHSADYRHSEAAKRCGVDSKGCARSERDGLLPTAVTKEDAAGPQRIS